MERLNDTEMVVEGEWEGLRRSKGRRLLNETIHLFCEPSTWSLILYQLIPTNAPVIMVRAGDEGIDRVMSLEENVFF